MSHKETCPGCGVYTSGVYLAMMRDEPCPHCGASLLDGSPPVAAPTLTEFLLARIAEDEAAVEGFWSGDGDPDFMWGPGRIRVECEAKRRFLREAEDQVSEYFSRFILETLALPYADHPDYDEEWKP